MHTSLSPAFPIVLNRFATQALTRESSSDVQVYVASSAAPVTAPVVEPHRVQTSFSPAFPIVLNRRSATQVLTRESASEVQV